MSLAPLFQSRRQLVTWLLGLAALAIFMALPEAAHATTTDTTAAALPWETPLASFRQSISGPVAFGVSIVGIVMTGAMLIWGGEINEFGRKGIMVVLVVALIVLANAVLTSLFTTAETLHGPAQALSLDPGRMLTLAGGLLAVIAAKKLRRAGRPSGDASAA